MKRKLRILDAAMLLLSAAAVCAVLLLPEPGPGVALETGSAAPHESFLSDDGRIDINKAPAEALELLPGIGSARAEAILDYRAEYGSFESEYQLLAVPGIGMDTLNGFIEYICVEDLNEDFSG